MNIVPTAVLERVQVAIVTALHAAHPIGGKPDPTTIPPERLKTAALIALQVASSDAVIASDDPIIASISRAEQMRALLTGV